MAREAGAVFERTADRPALHPPDICIVVPTFNERDNLDEIVSRVRALFSDRAWELIFVDDASPDGTAAHALRIAREDPRVRCILRIGRRGLSSACIEGMLATSAPVVAVMDADLQHDETLLVRMLEILEHEADVDIVIGSRYVEGGEVGNWSAVRLRTSRVATWLAQRIAAGGVADPMSGFFAVRSDIVRETAPNLSGIGFKILVDLLASAPRALRFVELPYEFRDRLAGESKLGSRAIWDYLMLLGDKTVGRYVPIRLLAFAAVGSLGVLAHLAVLAVLFAGAGAGFVPAQATATLTAMTFNFLVYNALTHRDRQLRRPREILRGWAGFVVACGPGAAANVGVAAYLFAQGIPWVLSALGGIAFGVLWNYAVTATYARRAVR